MTQDAAVQACHRPDVLRMDFQPIVDTARGTVVGYESLARFTGPPHAPPDHWFARARAAGVGAELEARALRTALEARSALPPNCFLSVNVGPDAMLSAPVAAVFADAGDLRGVVVEITEETPVTCYDALVAAIAPLRAAGALLAVDDAGAGFASLKHIMVLRPDFVKVDRDLVAGIDTDETKAAVVEALGMFTSRLDAWLLAEGVETTAELDRLLSLRVPLAQGYGLGLPRPVMGPADLDAVALCRRRMSAAGHGGLFDLAEHAARVTAPEAARPAFARDPALSWVAVVDEFDRPVELVDRRGGAHPPLRVLPAERLPDVARRVASRPAGERHAPLVLCDEHARLVGLVTVERVLGRLADALDTRLHHELTDETLDVLGDAPVPADIGDADAQVARGDVVRGVDAVRALRS
jgi:EAL domain-containing protein (putative c-di-GMP-specific phosphodiesterase class I)